MKQKFFVTSDIHSFFTPFKKALDEAGFDSNNKNHWLVVCGDCFDRGNESKEVLHFLMSLERKILVKGNHDILLEELCMREFPYSHDKSNGTVKTVQDIGGENYGNTFAECCYNTWKKTARYRESLVNYFETENYIFVHSWIPTKKIDTPHPADKWIPFTKDEWMEDWRNANDVEWENAMWGNPFRMVEQGLNQTNKTIISGHWHTSYAYNKYEGLPEFDEGAKFDIYYGDKYIGLDACCAYSKQINVLVLEDEFDNEWIKKYMESKYGQ